MTGLLNKLQDPPVLEFILVLLEMELKFEQLAWIPSRGDSQNQQEYTFTDTKTQAGNDYYYRIKQIDLDGQGTYVCTLVHIRTKGEAVQYLQVYPNPTQEVVTLSYYTDIRTTMDIQVLDVLGKKVLAVRYEPLELGSNQHQISLAQLPKGVYLLQISHSDYVYQITRRIVKQ